MAYRGTSEGTSQDRWFDDGNSSAAGREGTESMRSSEGTDGFEQRSASGCDRSQGEAEERQRAGRSIWRWMGQPVDVGSIDEGKKADALAACHYEHEDLVRCLKGGFSSNCNELNKAFWSCYAEHRGFRGNKISAWFAPPSPVVKQEKSGRKPSDNEGGDDRRRREGAWGDGGRSSEFVRGR
eukprot:TRINITY_DN22425_c0_g2_i1.p1 TRINITY_DN22425_c0_g2~~TRINITY_DN22425_c0_g2_i1.p1  ORF type:complete len:182 (+),score=34.55 TRINITY_DN22425_c0_g2_i1:468-1013(+)